MKLKVIAAYLKGFSKKRRMAFSFLEYISSFQRFMFFYYANEESDDVTNRSS